MRELEAEKAELLSQVSRKPVDTWRLQMADAEIVQLRSMVCCENAKTDRLLAILAHWERLWADAAEQEARSCCEARRQLGGRAPAGAAALHEGSGTMDSASSHCGATVFATSLQAGDVA